MSTYKSYLNVNMDQTTLPIICQCIYIIVSVDCCVWLLVKQHHSHFYPALISVNTNAPGRNLNLKEERGWKISKSYHLKHKIQVNSDTKQDNVHLKTKLPSNVRDFSTTIKMHQINTILSRFLQTIRLDMKGLKLDCMVLHTHLIQPH